MKWQRGAGLWQGSGQGSGRGQGFGGLTRCDTVGLVGCCCTNQPLHGPALHAVLIAPIANSGTHCTQGARGASMGGLLAPQADHRARDAPGPRLPCHAWGWHCCSQLWVRGPSSPPWMHKGGLGPQVGQPAAGGAGSNCACLSLPCHLPETCLASSYSARNTGSCSKPCSRRGSAPAQLPGALELSSWQSPPWSSLIPSAAGPGTGTPEQLAGS